MNTKWLQDKPTNKTRRMREWLKTEAGQAYRDRHKDYAKEWRKRNKELAKAIQQRSYDKIRVECLEHYGGARCKCCGETELRFLHLDHINGDGHLQRKRWVEENKKVFGGTGLYYWLKKNSYPPELKLQVLCANCNLGKRTHKYCPHELKRGTDMNGQTIPKEELPKPYPKVTRRLRGEAIAEAKELGVNVNTLRMRRWKEKHPTIRVPKPEPTHCKNGHAYAENLYLWQGHRQCRQCKRDYKARRNLKRIGGE